MKEREEIRKGKRKSSKTDRENQEIVTYPKNRKNRFFFFFCLQIHFLANFLADKNNARNIFIRFANKRGFDPLVAHNWYTVTQEEVITSQKVCLLVCLFFLIIINFLEFSFRLHLLPFRELEG